MDPSLSPRDRKSAATSGRSATQEPEPSQVPQGQSHAYGNTPEFQALLETEATEAACSGVREKLGVLLWKVPLAFPG